MKRLVLCTFVALFAATMSWGDDPPKEAKKDASPKEQFDALVKEFTTKRTSIMTEARKAKGAEQTKLLQGNSTLAGEFAAKIFKIAEDNPTDPVATDAAFWVMQNVPNGPTAEKATAKVQELVSEMPLKDLTGRLSRMLSARPALFDAALKRAEKDSADAASADLLAWVATTGANFNPAASRKAIAQLVEKNPKHVAIERVCATLGRRYSPDGVATLKVILQKSTSDKVKAAATLAMAHALAARVDTMGNQMAELEKVAAEAEKYFAQAIEMIGDGNAAMKKTAEADLKTLKTLRVGLPAPEIQAGDLDGKEFKLSDYRGKVVLLDFWGHW